MKNRTLDLIHTPKASLYEYWYYDSKQKLYFPLYEQYFAKAIPGYSSLNDQARA